MGNALKKLAVVAIVVVTASFVATVSVQAAERSRSGGYHTRRGEEGSFQTRMDRDRDSTSKETTWQNQRGEGSYQRDTTRDRYTNSWQSERETTNAAGKTSTSTRDGQLDGNGGYKVQGSGAGFNGREWDSETTSVKNEDGLRTTTKTYTGENGGSYTSDKTYTKTDDGWTATGGYETGGGKSGTYDAAGTRTDDGLTVDRSVTNQDGETATQQVQRIWDDETKTGTRTGTGTGFNGRTWDSESSVTYDDDQ